MFSERIMKIKFGVLLLSFVIIFTCVLLGFGCKKEDKPTPDGPQEEMLAVDYRVSNDGTYAVVSGLKGKATEGEQFCVTIDEIYSGKPVIEVEKNAFENREEIYELLVSERIRKIGESAFFNCANLTKLYLGNALTTIGNSAFQGCVSLDFVDIPSGVTAIGEYAFSGCKGIVRLSFAQNSRLFTIKNSAFFMCEGMTTIYLPNSVETIGAYAFGGCTSLVAVVIGNGTKSIGEGAFYGCDALKYVFYEESEGNWENITVGEKDNESLFSATVCFYSEEEPEENEDGTAYLGNFWHYVNGSPEIWTK